MLVRAHAVESLEHLVAFNGEPTVEPVTVGEQRAPHGMRVQHRARPAPAHDLEVQQRLGRRVARAAVDGAGLVDVAGCATASSAPLSTRARRDREPQRVATRDDAEVAAGAEHPAARVEAAADGDDRLGPLGLSRFCASGIGRWVLADERLELGRHRTLHARRERNEIGGDTTQVSLPIGRLDFIVALEHRANEAELVLPQR